MKKTLTSFSVRPPANRSWPSLTSRASSRGWYGGEVDVVVVVVGTVIVVAVVGGGAV